MIESFQCLITVLMEKWTEAKTEEYEWFEEIREDFKDLAYKKPYYLFIMERDGKFLVHPSFSRLQDWDKDIFDALSKATTEGLWVSYPMVGETAHTYVRRTKSGLIVGSGHRH